METKALKQPSGPCVGFQFACLILDQEFKSFCPMSAGSYLITGLFCQKKEKKKALSEKYWQRDSNSVQHCFTLCYDSFFFCIFCFMSTKNSPTSLIQKLQAYQIFCCVQFSDIIFHSLFMLILYVIIAVQPGCLCSRSVVPVHYLMVWISSEALDLANYNQCLVSKLIQFVFPSVYRRVIGFSFHFIFLSLTFPLKNVWCHFDHLQQKTM